MELSQKAGEFRALGIGVAGMTYDSIETNTKFVRKHQITFPMLSDVEAVHARRFGILNTEYEPGHRAYGVPYPGIMLVDANGKVYAKFAETGFRDRPPLPAVLERARKMIRR